jgi:hypothetical protein
MGAWFRERRSEGGWLAAESVVAVSRVCALPSFVDVKEHSGGALAIGEAIA